MIGWRYSPNYSWKIISNLNLDYATVFSLAPFMNERVVTIVGICIFIGAMAKSSQIGLHVWLPMAMEGPTPVSALIHAATMVTAGVYLLMRSSPLIEYSSTVLVLCLIIGAITTVVSSLIGLFQQDIKKVIAYSTMSQLARDINSKCIVNNRNQTICVETLKKKVNSQITNARKHYGVYISNTLFNSLIKWIWLFYTLIYRIEKWKFIIISKLVGISEAIRLIWIYSSFYHSTPTHVKNYSSISYKDDKGFNQWLTGVIDGDGHFIFTKKESYRLYIVMDIRDKDALYQILHKFGGSIRPISNANALRYNLSNRKGLTKLIEAVNGEIRNPTRLLQMNKLCVKFNIKLIYPDKLSFHNGWLSGFIDSDGSIYFSKASGQIFISASQKNKYLLDPLKDIYGGRVDPNNERGDAFKYVIYRKKELFKMVDCYFNKYPLRTMKKNRISLIKEFYEARLGIKSKDLGLLNKWVLFNDKWEKYQN